MKSSKWPFVGQLFVASVVVALGYAAVSRLPDPAWEVDRQAEATVTLAAGLEERWEDAYMGRLSASDVEKWGLAPRGWRRSGNGWKVGPDGERFEVGTWKEASGRAGFAMIFTHLDQGRCREMSRLLGNAFVQFAVNDKGQVCTPSPNKLVFYLSPQS